MKTTAEVLIDPAYRWQECQVGDRHLYYVGQSSCLPELKRMLQSSAKPDRSKLSGCLAQASGNFGLIVAGVGWAMAAVDKIRSYPVFYADKGGTLYLSNSARMLQTRCNLQELDAVSLLEAHMSGYVTHRETIFKDLFQLQAGEVLFWAGGGEDCSAERSRYFLFSCEAREGAKEDALVEELDGITDGIFREIIENARGKPIWVPLSGGLDSRLIVCKLKELGCDNLRTFSYGTPGNHEAKAARYVAGRLKVPWEFVPCTVRRSRAFFWSGTRRRYSDFADGLCGVPNYMDIFPLTQLVETRRIPSDAVIINGQSGDFITGGHIPPSLIGEERGHEALIDAIVSKHMSLWLDLKIDENLRTIRGKIGRVLEGLIQDGRCDDSGACLYECWEWQERQCKFVVSGQRIYDFFGFDWELPLWHAGYLEFWKRVPVSMKLGQRLYKKYLEKYDYMGLFEGFQPRIWRWPSGSIALVAVAQIVDLFLGRRSKELFYSYAKYFGHYRCNYGVYPFGRFMKSAPNHRNPYSLYVDTWLDEAVRFPRMRTHASFEFS